MQVDILNEFIKKDFTYLLNVVKKEEFSYPYVLDFESFILIGDKIVRILNRFG